jgi:hypothetical protein
MGDVELKINSVHDLLRLYDTEFLAGAYETLLGRPLDIDGVRSYLNAMREGHDREFVIYSLATSPEGLRFQSDLDGLPQFLRLQKRLRTAPFSILLKALYGLRRQRLQVNRLENMIGCLDSRLNKIESAAQTPREIASATLSPPTQDDKANSLIKSPRAREIFDRLTSTDILKG